MMCISFDLAFCFLRVSVSFSFSVRLTLLQNTKSSYLYTPPTADRINSGPFSPLYYQATQAITFTALLLPGQRIQSKTWNCSVVFDRRQVSLHLCYFCPLDTPTCQAFCNMITNQSELLSCLN